MCIDYATVKEVGGCDRGGTCGVLLDGGRIGKAKLPAPGSQVCVEYRFATIEVGFDFTPWTT